MTKETIRKQVVAGNSSETGVRLSYELWEMRWYFWEKVTLFVFLQSQNDFIEIERFEFKF